METQSKIAHRTLFIVTKGKGPGLENVKKFSKEMFERCLKNSCDKILADDKLQDNVLSDIELFELGEYHAHIMPSIIRMAVVSKPAHLEKLKLWENVCVNRGANVKVFINDEDAEKWLNQTQ